MRKSGIQLSVVSFKGKGDHGLTRMTRIKT